MRHASRHTTTVDGPVVPFQHAVMKAMLTRRAVLCTAALTTIAGRAAQAENEGALNSLLRRRRMVRRFRSTPVGKAKVRRLLQVAMRAPSAGHTEPWEFVVVRDETMRKALGRAAFGQMFVAEAPVIIVVCADLRRSQPQYGDRSERYGFIDTAFASLLLLLAVVEEGLGACFVGAFNDAKVSQLLGLPGEVRPVALIPVGYPAKTPPSQKLRPLREMVHEERW
jgi:nitroreductase